jgi:hypothetical protein
MSNPAHEQLLGYLLDACDSDERTLIEQRLQEDETLRRDLGVMGRAFDLLAPDRVHHEPPTGLADRCCQHVFERVAVMPAALSPVGVSAGVLPRRWSWLDISVAGAIAAAVLILIVPAVYQSRVQALKFACQNNLKDIGMALTNYSNRHGGLLPMAEPKGRLAHNGSWASRVVEEGDLPADGKALCPIAGLDSQSKLRIPSTAELDQMTPEQYSHFLRQLKDAYGYTLPYRDGNQIKGHRNLHRSNFAIVSDRPGPGPSNSRNHGGDGQNVLFEGGNYRYMVDQQLGKEDDDIFRNSDGEVAPGRHLNDSVIVGGDVRANQR